MSSHLVTLQAERAVAATYPPRRLAQSSTSFKEKGIGSNFFQGGEQVVLEVERAGSTATVTIYGSDAADVNGNPTTVGGSPAAQEFKGDGSTVAFQSNIPYVAYSNYNWIVTLSNNPLTGTVTVTAGSKTITGSSTVFLTELAVGDKIGIVGSEDGVIASITSDTVAALQDNVVTAAAGAVISTKDAPILAAGYTMSSGTSANGLCTFGTAPAANVTIRLYYAAVTTVYAETLRVCKRQIRSYDFMWSLLGATPSATSIWLRAIR